MADENINDNHINALPLGDATDSILKNLQLSNPGQNNNPYADLLNKFSGNTAPQLTPAQVLAPQNDYEQQARNEASQLQQAGSPQSFNTYYPSMENNIQKGYYSGSMIGSNPIYAPAVLYPYGLVDARQKALKDAADKKVAELDAYKNKIKSIQAPTTEHKAVQPEIQKQFYSGLNDWIDKAKKENPNGNPYKWLNENVDFHKWVDGVNNLSEYETQGAKSLAEYRKGVDDGKFVPTEDTKRREAAFLRGDHVKGAMTPEGFSDLGALSVLGMTGIKDPNALAEEVSKSLPEDIKESYHISPEEKYDKIISNKHKSVNEQKAADVIRASYDAHYSGRKDAPNFDSYAKSVLSRKGEENTLNVQTISTKDSDGHEFKMQDSDLTGQTDIIGVHGPHKTEGAYTAYDHFVFPVGTKAIEVPSTSNMKDIEGGLVASKKMTGDRTLTPASVSNVITIHKDGDPNDGKAILDSQKDYFKERGFNLEVSPKVNLTVRNKKGEYMGTISTDIDDLSSAIGKVDKDGKYKSGVNVGLYKQKAAERQDQLNKNSIPSASKQEWLSNGWNESQIEQAVKLGKIHVK